MLPALVFSALLCFGLAIGLTLSHALPPAAAWHLVFAAGIMPLIVGAITHFVPVLTRSGPAGPGIAALPLVSLAGGLLAAGAFAFGWFFDAGIALGAPLAFAASIALTAWTVARARRALGSPHPCLHWYAASAACLALALAAVMAIPLLPTQFRALRAFHLHLNTLGFIGLAALGTVQVLLPTAAGRPDPAAAGRLRQGLPLALTGVMLVAGGAGWWRPLAYPGALLLLVPMAQSLAAWMRLHRRELFSAHGAAPSLALAQLGFAVLIVASLAHAPGGPGSANLPLAFIVAFLLPLVTGAASQLLPTWLRPGSQGEWHAARRRALGRFAALRAFLFVASGIAVALGEPRALWVAAATLLGFVAQLVTAFARDAR